MLKKNTHLCFDLLHLMLNTNSEIISIFNDIIPNITLLFNKIHH
jgi:hypothetical protein